MLNSRKGNLLCFQWEVERFQKSHREKMEAVTPVMDTKPNRDRQQNGPKTTSRRSVREQLAESDVKRQNAFLVEQMAHIHHTGGFQRRSLNEFQDIKAALAFGKANVAVSQAARNGRFTARRKEQERIRQENANMMTRLASPKPSSINFHKFETDFVKSRAHHRLVRNNRTAGHTSVFFTPTTRALHHSGGVDTARSSTTPPTRHPGSGDAKDKAVLPRHKWVGQVERRGGANHSQHRQRPVSAGQILNKPRSAKKGRGGYGARDDTRTAIMTMPHRPQTAGVRRRRSAKARPHTALGLRRGADHHDLFDSRAADPGWAIGNSVVNLAERPPSAPARTEWGHWTDLDEAHCVNEVLYARNSQCEDDAEIDMDEQKEKEVDTNVVEVASLESGDAVGLTGGQGVDALCLGRTLLAEAKILVSTNTSSSSTVRESSRRIKLKCFSLDGLVRQRRRVQRTLRGFIVQARLVSSRRTPSNSELHNGSQGKASISVPVSAVQALLDNAPPIRSHGKTNTAPLADDEDSVLYIPDTLRLFREAVPLDDRGNYPALGTLLGYEGQRQLYEFLLASCRLELGDAGLVGFATVKPKIGKGTEISATIVDSNTRTNRPAPARRRRRVTVGNSSTPVTGAKNDNVQVTTPPIRGTDGGLSSGLSGASRRSSGPTISPSDDVFSSSDGRGVPVNGDGIGRAIMSPTTVGHSPFPPGATVPSSALSDTLSTADVDDNSKNDDDDDDENESFADGNEEDGTGRAVVTPTTAGHSPVRPEPRALPSEQPAALPNADVDDDAENDDDEEEDDEEEEEEEEEDDDDDSD